MFIKKTIFFIFCTVFVATATFSQQKATQTSLVFSAKPATNKGFSLRPINEGAIAPILPTVPLRPLLVAPAYSTTHWGFFCRQELKLEKATKIPFRFRLGSVQQCDRMEGKRVAVTL